MPPKALAIRIIQYSDAKTARKQNIRRGILLRTRVVFLPILFMRKPLYSGAEMKENTMLMDLLRRILLKITAVYNNSEKAVLRVLCRK